MPVMEKRNDNNFTDISLPMTDSEGHDIEIRHGICAPQAIRLVLLIENHKSCTGTYVNFQGMLCESRVFNLSLVETATWRK